MADVEESPAQRQARLRREKREKKILEGGTSRLEKITGVSGRSIALEPPSSPPKPAASTTPSGPTSPSETRPALAPSEPRVRPTAAGGAGNPSALPQMPMQMPDGSEGDQQQDFMQQLQKLLAGMPASPGAGAANPDASGFPSGSDDPAAGLPPGLASLLSGGGPAAPQTPPRSTYLWKILHLATMLALGAYILSAYAFTRSSAYRAQRALAGDVAAAAPLDFDFASLKNDRVTVFSLFASVQLALQSARYVLADRSAEAAGMVGMVAGFLPPPWGGRVKLATRYVGMAQTLVGDAMVVIFVLGMGAWWSGAGV